MGEGSDEGEGSRQWESVAKSGEHPSAVQLLRGVVMASMVSSSRKSSEVGGATLTSTTTERGCDGQNGEW